jgi:hypothetical protein
MARYGIDMASVQVPADSHVPLIPSSGNLHCSPHIFCPHGSHLHCGVGVQVNTCRSAESEVQHCKSSKSRTFVQIGWADQRFPWVMCHADIFCWPSKRKNVALPRPDDKALIRSGHPAVWARTRKSNCPKLWLTIRVAFQSSKLSMAIVPADRNEPHWNCAFTLRGG